MRLRRIQGRGRRPWQQSLWGALADQGDSAAGLGAGPGDVRFSVGKSPEGGYFSTLPRPVPRALVLTASPGSGIDEYPESDLSGITAGRVTQLQVEMDDGQVLETEPLRAPDRLRNRFNWLRGLRFFDLFFPEDQEPVLVTALDSQGRVLDWRRSARR